MENNELKDFIKLWEDELNDYIDEDFKNHVLLVEEIINHKVNIYSKEEIESLLSDAVDYIIEYDDDRCNNCGHRIHDDDYYGEYEARPYGSTTANEYVCYGYKCNRCGHEEHY